jgi:hypothetical protein
MANYILSAIEFRSEKLMVEVLLNGGVVHRDTTGADAVTQTKLNQWAIPDKNRLEVSLAPVRGEVVDPEASFYLQIVEGEHGAEPATTYEYRWDPIQSPVVGAGFTRVLEVDRPLLASDGPWAWERARPYAPGDRPAIEALVARVHAAFVARDAPGLVALTSLRNEEIARAFGVDPAEAGDFFLALYQGQFSPPDWRVDPLDTDALLLHPRSDGRLVEVTDAAMGPPVRGRGAGEESPFPMTVSHLEPGWTIVR